MAFPRGTPNVIGGSSCLIHVHTKLEVPDPLAVKLARRGEVQVVLAGQRGPWSASERGALPAAGLCGAPLPGPLRSAAQSRKRRRGCLDPGGTRAGASGSEGVQPSAPFPGPGPGLKPRRWTNPEGARRRAEEVCAEPGCRTRLFPAQGVGTRGPNRAHWSPRSAPAPTSPHPQKRGLGRESVWIQGRSRLAGVD